MRVNESEDVFFVYDGECPMCRAGVNSFALAEEEGSLHRINKRDQQSHHVVQEVKAQGYNVDRGMIIKYRGRFYQGAEALHLMSRIGAPKGWAGKISKALFRSRLSAYACYPFLRLARNILIRLKGVPSFAALERK